MATFRGAEGACVALVDLLTDAAVPTNPGGFPNLVSFELISADGIGDIDLGAGILPYRISVNGTYRRPAGRRGETGEAQISKLPIDVAVAIIVAADAVETKLALAGWIMRTIEDHPLLPVGLLNRGTTGSFFTGEAVEVTLDQVPHEELLHLWEVFSEPKFTPIMLPYTLRNIALESTLTVSEHAEVQERLFRYGFVDLGDDAANRVAS